jgi:enoyl-[acyl-carrier protein] reductase I
MQVFNLDKEQQWDPQLLSDMSRGVTGEIHHCDAGYHIVGMKHPDAPDMTLEKE